MQNNQVMGFECERPDFGVPVDLVQPSFQRFMGEKSTGKTLEQLCSDGCTKRMKIHLQGANESLKVLQKGEGSRVRGLHRLEVSLGCYMDGRCTDEGLHSWVLNRGFAQQRGCITGSFIAWGLHSLGICTAWVWIAGVWYSWRVA